MRGRSLGRYLISAAALFALLIPAVPGGAAGALRGSNFRISGPADDSSPAVAFNADSGRYLVVWEDMRNAATSGSDTRGRLVSAAGVPLGTGFRISSPAAVAFERSPAVAWNGSNGFLVVWVDERTGGYGGSDVFGRLVSAAGTPLGPEFRISGRGALDDEYDPAVAWNGVSGEYLVVWADHRHEDSRGGDIFGQRVRADGSLAKGNFFIGGGAYTYEVGPKVAWNDTGDEYLVVWGGGAGTYARRLRSDGSAAGTPFRVLDGEAPAVAWNGTVGEYLVVARVQRDPFPQGPSVFGRRLAADGSRLGFAFRIGSREGNAWAPALAWNATSQEYLVAWWDGGAGVGSVYARRVGADGSAVAAPFAVTEAAATGCDWSSAVTWNSILNQYLVVWQDARNSATRGTDIYGQRVAG